MIIPTMNDDDKAYEAYRIIPIAKKAYDEYFDTIINKFRKGTRFPYFNRVVFTDDKKNEWWLTFVCRSKQGAKKGEYWCFCYTIYFIPPRRMENDTYAGNGVLLFDPIACSEDEKATIIYDITPHAFNRYTQRYLKGKKLRGSEFQYKVENMMARWMHFDIEADRHGDINAQKHKKDNICPYDVIMSGGGMLRGQVVNNVLVRFSTYVSEDLMFDNQIERQEEMVREHYDWKRKGLYKETRR